MKSFLIGALLATPILCASQSTEGRLFFTGGVNTSGEIYACMNKGHIQNLSNLYGVKDLGTDSCDQGWGKWVEMKKLIPPGKVYVKHEVLGQAWRVGRGGTNFIVYWQ